MIMCVCDVIRLQRDTTKVNLNKSNKTQMLCFRLDLETSADKEMHDSMNNVRAAGRHT